MSVENSSPETSGFRQRYGKCLQVIVLLTVLVYMTGGCAVHQGRLEQLLRLEQADRESAIANLEADYQTLPTAWKAYFLGELNANGNNYERMNYWFDESLALASSYSERIEMRRAVLWHKQARAADILHKRGDVRGARNAYAVAAQMDPTQRKTAYCLAETQILLSGPSLGDIRTLAERDNLGAVWRWLDQQLVTKPDQPPVAKPDQMSAVRERLESELQAAGQPGTAKHDSLAYGEAAYVLGELYRLQQNHTTMATWYTRALNWGTSQAPRIRQARRGLADGYLEHALAAYVQSDVRSALAHLDTCDLIEPGRSDAHDARVNLNNLGPGLTDSALREYLANDQIDYHWLMLLLSDLYHQQRYAAAGLVAEVLLRSDPQHSLALLARARRAIESGDRAAAAVDLKEILTSGVTNAEVAYDLGIICLDNSAYNQAWEYFAQALRWSEEPGHALRQMAVLAFYRGKFAAMKRISHRLATEFPNDSETWRILMLAAQLTSDDRLVVACRQRLEQLQ